MAKTNDKVILLRLGSVAGLWLWRRFEWWLIPNQIMPCKSLQSSNEPIRNIQLLFFQCVLRPKNTSKKLSKYSLRLQNHLFFFNASVFLSKLPGWSKLATVVPWPWTFATGRSLPSQAAHLPVLRGRYGCFQKYRYPKMDGENNGKPH